MKRVPFVCDDDRSRQAEAAARHLRSGGILAYPTETVYGLGCGLQAAPIARLAELKQRDAADRPFLLLVASWPPAGVIWTSLAERLADTFWPGPLTLVLRAEAGRFPAGVTGRGGSVAVRCSPHPGVMRILESLGEPITSTSANARGEPPARDADAVVETLRRMGTTDDVLVLDGGELPASAPSTVLNVSGASPRVLRPGAIGTDALRRVLGGIDAD